MSVPLQVAYRGLDSTEAISELIQSEADRLGELSGKITRCRVLVEAPSKHHTHGGHYKVQVDLSVPGKEIIAAPVAAGDTSPRQEDLYAAIRDAFDAARRRLVADNEKRHHHRG